MLLKSLNKEGKEVKLISASKWLRKLRKIINCTPQPLKNKG